MQSIWCTALLSTVLMSSTVGWLLVPIQEETEEGTFFHIDPRPLMAKRPDDTLFNTSPYVFKGKPKRAARVGRAPAEDLKRPNFKLSGLNAPSSKSYKSLRTVLRGY